MKKILKLIGVGLASIIIWAIPVIVVLKPSIATAIGIDPMGTIKEWIETASSVFDGKFNPFSLFTTIKGSIPVCIVLVLSGSVLLVLNKVFHLELIILKKIGITLLLIVGIPLAILLVYTIISMLFMGLYVVLTPIGIIVAVIFWFGMALGCTSIFISDLKAQIKKHE